MFTKATLGLAVILATVSGALATTKTHINAVRDAVHDAYNNPSARMSAPTRTSTFALN